MRKETNKIALAVHTAILDFREKVKAIPFMLEHAFSKHGPILDKHVKDFHDTRINLCKELAEKDDDNNPIMEPVIEDGKPKIGNNGEPETTFKFSEEVIEELNSRYQKLLDDSVEVPTYKIKAEDVKDLIIPVGEIRHLQEFMDYFIK